MSFQVENRDLALLETAYEIGKFLIECNKEYESRHLEYFCRVPFPNRCQTKTGLVLEEYYGSPTQIHTPLGSWRILSANNDNKVTDAIKKRLGLELFQEGEQTDFGFDGPYWTITKWKEMTFEKPVYREESEYIPDNTVVKIWDEFAANHEGLSKE